MVFKKNSLVTEKYPMHFGSQLIHFLFQFEHFVVGLDKFNK